MGERTFLVTGALGCIGAWTVFHLQQAGERVVAFDLSDDRHRLDLLLRADAQAAVTFVHGDVSDATAVLDAVAGHGITHIIHLAALQIPFCRADPVRGARVNVVGTVNVFEAARAAGIGHLAYASSVAVFGPRALYPEGPVADDAPKEPQTLYGVTKVANEGTARVYWGENGIGSTGLRPYTVYGLGRDQGLTSDPTQAMLAAVAGRPFHINFGARMQIQWASDVARQFIIAAERPLGGAHVFNLGGPATAVAEVVALIKARYPAAELSHSDRPLPFSESFDDSRLRAHLPVVETPLADGVARTLAAFEARLADGRLSYE